MSKRHLLFPGGRVRHGCPAIRLPGPWTLPRARRVLKCDPCRIPRPCPLGPRRCHRRRTGNITMAGGDPAPPRPAAGLIVGLLAIAATLAVVLAVGLVRLGDHATETAATPAGPVRGGPLTVKSPAGWSRPDTLDHASRHAVLKPDRARGAYVRASPRRGRPAGKLAHAPARRARPSPSVAAGSADDRSPRQRDACPVLPQPDRGRGRRPPRCLCAPDDGRDRDGRVWVERRDAPAVLRLLGGCQDADAARSAPSAARTGSAFQQRLPGVLGALDAARERAREPLASREPPEQADAAFKLAAAYEGAAASMTPLIPKSSSVPEAIVHELTGVASAYRVVASALQEADAREVRSRSRSPSTRTRIGSSSFSGPRSPIAEASPSAWTGRCRNWLDRTY